MSHACRHSGAPWRSIHKLVITPIVLLGITAAHANASEARFIPLPEDFEPKAISGDGSVIAGRIFYPEGCLGDPDLSCYAEAAIWTEAGGIERLGFLDDDHTDSDAMDISADGSVIVGFGFTSGDPLKNREAFRWTRESGMVGLGVLPGHRASIPYSVSGDGTVVVGFGARGNSYEAFRWTEETGMVGIGGTSAREVSWNGSVVFGKDDNNGRAFRWTNETGLTYLDRVPGDTRDDPFAWPRSTAMSVDGRKFVGSVRVGTSAWEPWQWTEAGGLEMLPNWESTYPWWSEVGGPYHSEVYIRDMSDDGTFVSGSYRVREAPDYYETQDDIMGSFIWDEQHGFRDVHDLLASEYGLATEMANWSADWRLYGLGPDISYDGRRIVGYSYEQGYDLEPPYESPRGLHRGWLAILGPPFQPGDANRDEVFNSSDLVQVLQAGQYEDDIAGNSLWKDGDWNWDGEFTSSDLVVALVAGNYEHAEPADTNAVPEPSAATLLTLGLCALVPISLFRRGR